MKKAIFFYASSDKIGLTSHFAAITPDLYENSIDMDFYIVSDTKEQNPGLWNNVEKKIPSERIVKFNDTDYSKLNESLENVIQQYDRIIFHFQGIKQILNTKPLLNKYKNKISGIVTIHSFRNGTWKRRFTSFIYSKVILKYIDKAIFLSPFAWKNFCGSSKLFKKNKISHIPFSLPAFNDNIEEDNILDTEDFNITYLANFTKNKGHERFLNGLIRFVNENKDTKVYFLGEGVRRNPVIEKIKQAGLSNNILCPGRIDRKFVPSVLKKTSISLVLSGSETAGHTITEPMMAGLPLISTRVGFGEYLVQDGINAYGISTPDELYWVLKKLKDTPELREEIGNNAKKIVSELYDYNRMIKAFINLYKEL